MALIDDGDALYILSFENTGGLSDVETAAKSVTDRLNSYVVKDTEEISLPAEDTAGSETTASDTEYYSKNRLPLKNGRR